MVKPTRRGRPVRIRQPPDSELSEYEKCREENIRQRQEYFKSLQLDQAKNILKINARKRKSLEQNEKHFEEEDGEQSNESDEVEINNESADETEEDQVDDEPSPKKRKPNMTKKKKAEEKRKEAEEKLKRLLEAKSLVQAGAKCATTARAYGLAESTLRKFDPSKVFKPGRGKVSKVLTEQEEQEVVEGVVKLKGWGYGLTYPRLRASLQLILQRLCQADPNRRTGFEKSNQLPSMDYVYRFVNRRASLALRAGMELSPARASLSLEDITQWFQNFETQILTKPGIAEAMQDPRRVCNAVSLGVGVRG